MTTTTTMLLSGRMRLLNFDNMAGIKTDGASLRLSTGIKMCFN